MDIDDRQDASGFTTRNSVYLSAFASLSRIIHRRSENIEMSQASSSRIGIVPVSLRHSDALKPHRSIQILRLYPELQSLEPTTNI